MRERSNKHLASGLPAPDYALPHTFKNAAQFRFGPPFVTRADRMLRTTLLASIALAATPSLAQAQDPLTVGPAIYKRILENDRVRVLEARFKPGAKMGMHSHPDHLLYMLTDGSLIFKPPGKTPFEITLNAGEALWLPAQSRAAENDGDKEVRALVVELKQPVRVAAGKAARGKRVVAKGKRKRKR